MKAYMAITGVGLGVLLALTGCASAVNEAAPAIAPEPVFTVEQVVEPIEGDTDGDGKLSAWESEQLMKSVYILPDGSAVPIPKDQPLPQAVVDAVEAVVSPPAQYLASGDAYTVAEREVAYWDAVQEQSRMVNRTIITVMYGFGDHGARMWVASDPMTQHTFDSKEEAIAAVNTYIGSSTDKYVLIVID
jgi:hypothetical protein